MLNNEERKSLEEAIEDATAAARIFLGSNKQVHFQLLVYCVGDVLDLMTLLGTKLNEDRKIDSYRLRALVPTQIVIAVDPDAIYER